MSKQFWRSEEKKLVDKEEKRSIFVLLFLEGESMGILFSNTAKLISYLIEGARKDWTV